MKITFVTTHLTVFGGGGKFLMDYANKLSEKGHYITIIAQKIDRSNYKFNETVALIEIGAPLPSNPFYWLRFNKIKKKYLNSLNKLDNNLIISIHFPTNYICSNVMKKNRLKHIHFCLEPYRIFHDKNFYSSAPFFNRIKFWLLRTFFKKYDIEGTVDADEIICISDFIRKKVRTIYGRNGYLHYIGVDFNFNDNNLFKFDLKQNFKLEKKTPIIFTLGLTHHKKGAKELIYIFDRILKQIPEATLLIGGWIKKENKVIIKKLMRKLKIPKERIIFYGFIKNDQVKCFYEKSNLTFYTAYEESYGLIPLESMACGTPVIAFKGGGPSETIINGKTGYLINTYDFDEFAQKTINLLKDKNLYKEFSINAKEHVRENFSFEKSCSNLELILKKIVSKD